MNDQENYLCSYQALQVMQDKQLITDGSMIYYLDDIKRADGEYTTVVFGTMATDHAPIMVILSLQWVPEMKNKKFRLWKKKLNSLEAEEAMKNGHSVVDKLGAVYTAGDVTLDNDVSFRGVFMKEKSGRLVFAGLLQDFGSDPLAGEYYIYEKGE